MTPQSRGLISATLLMTLATTHPADARGQIL
jgi:hypothetical protein